MRSIVLNNSVGEANDYVSKCYRETDFGCTFEEFKKAIVPLVEALSPNEGLTIESSKDIDTNDCKSVTIHRTKGSETRPMHGALVLKMTANEPIRLEYC